jgi:transmembrane sensor
MQPEKAALEQLINKYLEGNCTPEEKETLYSWIEQLDLVKAPLISDQTGLLLKERIDKANALKNSKHQLNWWRPVIYSAASIFFAALFISLYYFTGRNNNVVKPSIQLAALKKKHTVTFYNITNVGTRPHLLILDDGSTVLLEGKSTLLREVPFGPLHRKVELHGKAFFRIAKNKKKPFDVFSGNITTTALGTSFWVDQNTKNGSIQVKLITGKVVIRDHRPERQKLLGYLVPGQQLAYNISKGTAVLSNSLSKPARRIEAEPHNTPAPLIFAQTPMDKVLDRIQDYYKIKIKYNPDDVRSMVVYGNYNSQDNVELILKTITVSNGLTLTKSGDDFLISK